jgi:glucan biosynthesis protein C
VGLPDKTGRLWLGIAVLLILVWLPMMVAVGAITDQVSFKGGWHWQSLVYALWESFLCISVCVGLIYAFRRYLDHQGKLAGFLVPNAYTAYIIHAPVITTLAFAVRDVMLYPLLKWAVVALVAVPLCFALSSPIRKLPYADRIL